MMTSAMRPHTIQPSGWPASTIVMTCATRSGWARLVSAPITESTATQMSTGRCSKRKGSSWRNVARGPVAAFPPRENGLRRVVWVCVSLMSSSWSAR